MIGAAVQKHLLELLGVYRSSGDGQGQARGPGRQEVRVGTSSNCRKGFALIQPHFLKWSPVGLGFEFKNKICSSCIK